MSQSSPYPAVELRVDDEPSAADVAALNDRLYRHNAAITGCANGRSLTIFVRDGAREIMAGLHGWTWGQKGFVQTRWVREDLRGRGLGADGRGARTAPRGRQAMTRKAAKRSAPPTPESRQLARLARELKRQATRAGIGKKPVKIALYWQMPDGRLRNMLDRPPIDPATLPSGPRVVMHTSSAMLLASVAPRYPSPSANHLWAEPTPTTPSRRRPQPVADVAMTSTSRNKARWQPAPSLGETPVYSPEQRHVVAPFQPIPARAWRRSPREAVAKFSVFEYARARRG